MTISHLIPAALLCAMLTSCAAPRTGPDIHASYLMAITSHETVPRAFRGGKAVGRLVTPADIAAVPCRVVTGADIVTAYHPATDHISLQLSCTMPELMHELEHRRQVLAGEWELWSGEAGAMRAEVAQLCREGWTDKAILGLSRNNANSSKELAMIRASVKP